MTEWLSLSLLSHSKQKHSTQSENLKYFWGKVSVLITSQLSKPEGTYAISFNFERTERESDTQMHTHTIANYYTGANHTL